VSWSVLFLLAGGAYAFKALGLVVLGGRRLPPPVTQVMALLPAALLPAIVVVGTFAASDHRGLVLDARFAGVATAGLAAWRRAPFPVVIVLGALVSALVRRWG
jgi:branched-subunit amino acid transport protein